MLLVPVGRILDRWRDVVAIGRLQHARLLAAAQMNVIIL